VHQSDWVLRQIELMGALIRRMLSSLREQRPDDVIRLADEAVAGLLELDASLADALTGEALVSLLSAGGTLDVDRAAMLGEVLAIRASAHRDAGNLEERSPDAERARRLIEAVSGEVDERIEQIVARSLELLSGIEP
jgi:hypothetical protein